MYQVKKQENSDLNLANTRIWQERIQSSMRSGNWQSCTSGNNQFHVRQSDSLNRADQDVSCESVAMK